MPAPPATGVKVIFTLPDVAGSGKLIAEYPLALMFDPFTTKMLPCAILLV